MDMQTDSRAHLDPKDPQIIIQYPDDGPRFIKSRGMRFPNDTRYITPARRRALRTNAYEAREAEAIKAILKRDDVVLELGAGMGYMSTFMARKLKVKEVHAFEANPHMIPYIEEVYRQNNIETAHIHNAILGKRKGTAKFYVRSNFVASSLEENPKGGGPVIDVVDVEVRNFNSVLKKLKPTVLVCDIEGAEADLLPGTDLSCLRAAVVELHPQWIGQKGVQDVFDVMNQAGLTYFPKRSNAKVVTFKKGW